MPCPAIRQLVRRSHRLQPPSSKPSAPSCPTSNTFALLPKRLQKVLLGSSGRNPQRKDKLRHLIRRHQQIKRSSSCYQAGRNRPAMSQHQHNFPVYGAITRELYDVWCRGLNVASQASSTTGAAAVVYEDQLQSLFHQAELYPSQSQILEMIHCARERPELCSSKAESDPAGKPTPPPSSPATSNPDRQEQQKFLTFGEFCLFANELRRCYEKEIPRPTQVSSRRAAASSSMVDGGVVVVRTKKGVNMSDRSKKISSSSSSKSTYQVFLGGSCNPTTWRQDVAIPCLKTWGITYFNPQVPQWGPELIEKEHHAKQTADVLFFVVDRQTRSVATIIEAAYYTASQQKVLILVVHPYQGPGQLIQGEPITESEYEDLANGQLVLQDMVERLGIPVFTNVRLALDCTAKILRERITVQDLGLSDGINPVKNSHYPIGDKLLKLRDAFNALDTTNSGELSMADVCMAFRILTNRDLSVEDLKNIVASSNEDASVNFDQFCCILTEFRNLPASNKTSSDEVHERERRLWDILVGKAGALLYSVVSPVSRILCRPSSSSSSSSSSSPGCKTSAGTSGANQAVPAGLARSDSSASSSIDSMVGGPRDVYLGGSCGSTNWRESIAIPLLKKSGLTYFNPQACGWSRRFIPIEAAAMDASRVLIFVISRETRSLASMALAAYYIGLGCNVVLCVQHLTEGTRVNGETLTASALKDYNRGRNYLSDLANREGVPVFEEISEAVQCAIQRCQQEPR